MSDEADTEAVEVKCQICGGFLTVEVPKGDGPFDRKIRSMAENMAAHDICQAGRLSDAREAERRRRETERRARLEIAWNKACPEEFRATINYQDADCSREIHAQVLRWQRTSRKGLILAGPTGRCKTRFLWDLLKREHYAGIPFYMARHPEWRRKASRLAGESQTELDKWIGVQAKIAIWAMDDLGKGTVTPASEEALESLIDERSRRRLPMLFTTNDSADSLTRRLSADRGAPMVRRILDTCDVVKF